MLRFQVLTDGIRIQIFAPQRVHGRACGLCGDFDGEAFSDLRSPGRCILKKDKHFAYSYMLNKDGVSSNDEGQCSGIPYSDREEFKKEIKKCAKTDEELPTPVVEIARDMFKLAKPKVSTHLVKKLANRLCVSREMIQLLARHPSSKIDSDKTIVVRPRIIEFSCVGIPSWKAYSLEHRANRGENLQAELRNLPIHLSTIEYEPEVCLLEESKPNHNHQQEQQKKEQLQRNHIVQQQMKQHHHN